MKVTVIGGGPVGLTYCALLMKAGHEVKLWSESHPDEKKWHFTGCLEESGPIPTVTSAEQAVAFADTLVIARRATGTQSAIEALAPLLHDDQVVIFSAELSFASLYLASALRAVKRQAKSISWSTTVTTAQRKENDIRVGTIRDTIDMASTGFDDPAKALELCKTLFGERFRMVAHPAVIGLSNLNPPIHLANSLANLTRIERGEDWENYQCITPVVGRMIEKLDLERTALAKSLGYEVRDVFAHYLMTFPGIVPGNVSEMAQQVYARAPGTKGPISLDTRYITEDVPFGLVPLCALARRLGKPLKLHEAGIQVLSNYLGRDLWEGNNMMDQVLMELDSVLDHAA